MISLELDSVSDCETFVSSQEKKNNGFEDINFKKALLIKSLFSLGEKITCEFWFPTKQNFCFPHNLVKCQYEFIHVGYNINKDILLLCRSVLSFINKSVPGKMYKF